MTEAAAAGEDEAADVTAAPAADAGVTEAGDAAAAGAGEDQGCGCEHNLSRERETDFSRLHVVGAANDISDM